MLAESHGKRSMKDRKAKKAPIEGRMPTLTDMYTKADDLVSLVYVDIANGVSRSDVISKLKNGLYGNKPYKERQCHVYYNAALDRFAVDTDIEMEKLRNLFFGRYEALFEEAVKRGDIFNAKGVLDSMARIYGIEHQKTPQTAIQVNNGEVKINFGFDNAVDSEYKEVE